MNESFNERYRRGGSAQWDPTRQRWTDEDDRGNAQQDARWSGERGARDDPRGGWQDERRRERLSPYQLSEGGPPWGEGEERDFRRDYGQRDYPDHPEYGSGARQGSDLSYGLNGRYERGADDDRETGDRGRRGERFESRNADVDWLRDAGRSGQRGESDWREDASRRPYRHQSYFNDLRTTQPYRAESGPAREDRDWQEHRREAERRQGDWDSRRNQRPERDERHEHDQGLLYRLGHRLGEAVGEMFGTQPEHPERERRAGPKGYRRSDDSIRDQLCTRLAYATGVDVSNVSVEVESGVVTLTGTVRRRNEKFDIEDIADNTFGVTDVENNIRVQREGSGDAMATAGVSAQPETASSTTGTATTAQAGATAPQGVTAGGSTAAGTGGAAESTGKTWSPD